MKPSILDAVSCRVPAVRAAAANSTAPLQRQDIDTKLFPNAACNDGTPAVLNFRPYEGEANRNKWVIALNGGGSCLSGQDCADRWCGVGTNFDADNMSSANAGGGLPGDGILRRSADNPFANWNQVSVRYCSSDHWTGKGLATTLTAKDPKTGKDVTYQIDFAGGYVYEAMLATLRQEGVPALSYTHGARKTDMPDLDDASDVVFAGGSAGGAGVINNLDRFADTLRGGRNHPVVRGFIEAAVGPDTSLMGYTQSTECVAHQLCSYDTYFRGLAAIEAQNWQRWTDQSCLDWHQKNAPGSEWQCADLSHVLANHITTPYFVRMGLSDQLVSGNAIEAHLTGADGKLFTRLSWAAALQNTLSKLQQAVAAGHEKSSVTKAPGIFAPSCGKHYTIFSDDAVYGATTTAAGKSYTLFDVWNNWVAGQKPDVVISADPRTDKCPGE